MTHINETRLQNNPYPGIRSFEIEESHLFFGRDKQTDDLYKILKSTHFIAITGASGSGKSSLVKAGLIPKLHEETQNWFHHIFRPGNNPISNFAESIFETLKSNNTNKTYSSKTELENILRSEKNPIEHIFKSIDTDAKHLIYVDQFEEIFRFRQNEYQINAINDSELFVELLVKGSKLKHLPIYFIITLRSDFLSDCSYFSGLTQIINDGHYLIPRMTLEEKEEALTGPASVTGTSISDNLKQLIKTHLNEYDISLPVFQHALMRTWDYWLENAEYGKPIDKEHYEAVGTVTDALSVHAEYIFSSLNNEESKNIAERIFKSLTHLGEDNRGTRSPKTLNEIISILNERNENIIHVLDQFRDEKSGFLLPPKKVPLNPNTVIDISHESIMRIWGRLVRWVQKETESAQLYLRISKSSELYQEGKTGLLVNPDLQLALKWYEENKPNEVWAQRYDPAFDRAITYLEHSQKKWENAIKAKEEKQKRGLRRARFIAIFLGSASIISILFLVVAMNLKFKADDSKRKALDKEKLAVQKSIIAEDKKREAVSHKKIAEQQQLIAIEQRLIAEENKQYAVNQQKEAFFQKKLALIAKYDAEKARDIARELQIRAENLRDEALRQKLIAENQRSRAEFSEAKTDTLRRISIAKSLSAQAIKIYRNNKKTQKLSVYEENLPNILALQSYYFNKMYGGLPNDPDIFSALSEVSETGLAIRGKNIHTDGIRDLAISKNGKYFVSCSDDGTVNVFDTENPEKDPLKLNMGTNGNNNIRSIDINNTGQNIVAGTYNGDILYWSNIAVNPKPIVLKGHVSVVNHVSFTDNFIFSASNDGTIRKWSVENLSSEIIYKKNTQFFDFMMSPDGKYYAIAAADGEITLLQTDDTKNQIILFEENHQKVLSLFWISNNEIVAGYSSGKIRIIKNKVYTNEFYAHLSGVSSLFYDKNYKRIISTGYDGTIKLWNYNDLKEEPIVLFKHSSWVYCALTTINGKKLISGGADKQIIITPIDIEELKSVIRKKTNTNMDIKDWIRYVGKDIEYKSELPE
jgi:WD40 repeat protein/energy-coupling factor transporter ATP-binding protein EcfA2